MPDPRILHHLRRLARQVGVAKQTASAWWCGRRRLPGERAVQIAVIAGGAD